MILHGRRVIFTLMKRKKKKNNQFLYFTFLFLVVVILIFVLMLLFASFDRRHKCVFGGGSVGLCKRLVTSLSSLDAVLVVKAAKSRSVTESIIFVFIFFTGLYNGGLREA